jgi:hypothetical protein
MTLAGVATFGLLAGIAAVSTWAVFSRHFDDNLLQRIGLSVLAIACAARAVERLAYDPPDIAPAAQAVLIGIAVYAAGTAWKLVRRSSGMPNRRMRRGLGAYLREGDRP